MADELIDEPIDLYNNQLKEAHKNNVSKFFEDLVKKSGVKEEENVATVKEIRKKEASISDFDKKLKKQKNLRGFLIFLVVIGFLAMIVFAYSAYDNQFIRLDMWINILIAVACLLFAVGFILVIALVVNKKIKNFKTILAKLHEERNALEKVAWEQAAPLNSLYDWGMSAYLFTETIPIVKLDPYFDVKRFDYLCSKYGLIQQFDEYSSVEFVQSGEIVGNPFLVVRKLNHHMGEKTYHGELTITWTEYYHDSNGHLSTRTRTQVLHASVVKPYPEYAENSDLIYGNEAAPDLCFSRKPLGSHKLNEKELQRLIKERTKVIEATAKDAIKKQKSFTPLANTEFEALFNALNRDNETQYRLLFTPLAQVQLKKLLLDKSVGYGDDFYMQKAKMLNFVEPEHFSNFDFSANPGIYINYEINHSRQMFNNYNNNYFRSLYFGFAPLLCIPLYQMHKPHEFIYKDTYKYNVSFWEDEAMANYMDVSLLKHPESITHNILKTQVVDSRPGADLIDVTAHGYKGVNRVDYVSVHGDDGCWHDVPVPWVEYIPVWKKSQMVIKVKPDLTRKDYLGKTKNQGWNNFLQGAYSDLLFRRNMVAFICNKTNSYGAGEDAALDELLK